MKHVMNSDRVCRGRLREKTGYGTRNAEMWVLGRNGKYSASCIDKNNVLVNQITESLTTLSNTLNIFILVSRYSHINLLWFRWWLLLTVDNNLMIWKSLGWEPCFHGCTITWEGNIHSSAWHMWYFLIVLITFNVL